MGKTTNAFQYFCGFSKSSFWLFLLLIQGQIQRKACHEYCRNQCMAVPVVFYDGFALNRLQLRKFGHAFLSQESSLSCPSEHKLATRSASRLFGALAHSFPIYSVCFMAGCSGSPGITL